MASNVHMNIIKMVQGVGYLFAFILSLVICVPMSMNQDQFKGRCLLFSQGEWQQKDGQFIVADWASQAYCNFTIFVAVIMFVISVIQLGRFFKFLKRGRDSSFFSAFVDVLLCVIMCIFVLIAACFVSFGFNTWCNEMTRRFPSCSEATGSVIDKADGIDSTGFFFQMSVAQFGVWLSFTVWLMLLTFSVVKLCKFHHEENLRVSMAKERKRLLNEDLVSEVPVNPSSSSFGDSRRRRGQSGNSQKETGDKGRFEELEKSASNEAAGHDCGLVNDVVTHEDFHHHHDSSPVVLHQQSHNEAMNLEDGSMSSMASSQHSYSSLPKGNQITIEQMPDLLT